MADTDTLTRIVPQDGWSPIICRMVPIQQTITNIVGDKGANEIWQGGSIKNFHAKIDWQDQYSGSRVPADIISESSTDNGATWTMDEVEEHEEGSFELDYEGHERDFEVKLNGTDLYIRYRWLMNGQEIEDADGSYEHTIAVADYPVKLVIDAHYADNFGGHEIGANIFNSAKIFYKSGAVDDTKTKGDFTKPLQATLWADKDGWQTQTWSYTKNGRTVTAQVGANITALRDVKIEAELLGGGSGELESLIATYDEGEDIFYKVNVDSSILEDGTATIYCKEGDYEYSAWLYDESRMTLEYFGYESFSGTPSGIYLLPNGSNFLEVFESLTFYSDEDCTEQLELTFVRGNSSSETFKEGEVVSKNDLKVTMTRNDGSTYEATDYWMPNNYALGRNKQSVTVQKGSLSTTLPVTVAYSTKVEVGNVVSNNFVKSSFYEYGEYVEPTHYNTHYECYDGTEGFDEVAEIDSEWESKVERVKGYQKFSNYRLYEIEGIVDSDYDEDGELRVYGWEEGKDYFSIRLATYQDLLALEGFSSMFSFREGCGYILWNTESESYPNVFYNDGDLYLGQYYRLSVSEDGEILSVEPLTPCPLSEMPEAGSAVLGEYGSAVGTLTLGSKKYLYRVGLEPIDEENYLFIKDFKDIPFNYGLVNCYEPQWEEPVVEGGFEGLPSEPTGTMDGLGDYYHVVAPSDGADGSGYAVYALTEDETISAMIYSGGMLELTADQWYFVLNQSVPEGTKFYYRVDGKVDTTKPVYFLNE